MKSHSISCQKLFQYIKAAERIVPLIFFIKRKGFDYATKAGITIGITDIEVPEEKEKILSEADEKVDQVELLYRRGLISEDERYEKTLDIWTASTEEITEALMNTLDPFNSIYMMAFR